MMGSRGWLSWVSGKKMGPQSGGPSGVSAATGEAYAGDFSNLWIGVRKGIDNS